MSISLLSTKFFIPHPRANSVVRQRLTEKLLTALNHPGCFVLLSSPAGFGKTTLLSEFKEVLDLPVAWVSLDKNDNQAGRFLSYLVAALQKSDHTIGNEAAQIMAAAQPAAFETILTSLINDLDTAQQEIVLVLDDYQLISSQAVHEEVAFLLENCPKTLHLVIATRSDPPIPLARYRARGQMVELRAADLCFTESEAAQFLNDVMGLHLDAGSVAALKERTEGWIAGLQMAALSMRDREDVLGFIKGFSGTNRYILDYLLEEVLAGQPPDVQRFLLCTSILERLTAPLCDAVFFDESIENREWSVDQSNESRSNSIGKLSSLDSRSILEYLERANLFLIPLDDERIWYRYHHLFADLLRTRLDKIHPGLSSQLHALAAAWLEREGMMVEAVNHTLSAGEYAHAARLVEENTTRLLAQGELNALEGWIEVLPAALRSTRPWLCIHQAYVPMFAGKPSEVEPLLFQAEVALEAISDQCTSSLPAKADRTGTLSIGMAETRAIKGAIAAVRAYVAVFGEQESEALIQAQQARELLPAGDLFDQSLAVWAIGKTMLTQGRLPEAQLAFEEHIRFGRAMGNIWTLLSGLTYRAQVLQAQGKLTQARANLEEALAEASQQGARSRGFIAWVEDGLASVLYEQNELEAAHRLIAEAIELNRQWPNPNQLVYAFVLLARVLRAQGDLQGARIAISKADKIRKSALLSRWLRRTVEADLVRVWLTINAAGLSLAPATPLADQASELVASWRSELEGQAGGEDTLLDECTEIAALNLARVELAAGKAEEALSLLEPVTRSACAAGHINAAIGSLVLTAIAWQGRPVRQAPGTVWSVPALKALEEALSLANPGGYLRVFLDEGKPMQQLLAHWLAHAGTSRMRDYAVNLLSQFNAEPGVVSEMQGKVTSAVDLIEPLSQREIEVLHILALGSTNQEIARQLFVAPGTVKAHAASIYRKLDVTNRTEAVARARQLGILP